MLVTCPHCGFVTAPLPPPEGGAPRCPRCDGVLDPTNVVTERRAAVAMPTTTTPDTTAAAASAPVATDASTAEADARPAPTPTGAAAAAAVVDAGTSASPAVAASAPAVNAAPASAAPAQATPPKPTAASARKRAAPSFARGRDAAAPRRDLRREWLAVPLLLFVLALQLLLAQRHELATQARWRPLLEGLCGALRCELPAWREPAAFALLDRGVQPVPGRAGVLRASASFRNDARWPQPWPTLRLGLSDVDGREVGARAFAPSEYRRDHRAGDLLAPGQSASVQLDVVEPAPNIVAFAFDFE